MKKLIKFFVTNTCYKRWYSRPKLICWTRSYNSNWGYSSGLTTIVTTEPKVRKLMGYESNFLLIYEKWFINHKTLIWHCSAPQQLLARLDETTPNEGVMQDRQVLQGRARSSERKEGGDPTSVSPQRELRSASWLKVYLTFFFTRMKRFDKYKPNHYGIWRIFYINTA